MRSGKGGRSKRTLVNGSEGLYSKDVQHNIRAAVKTLKDNWPAALEGSGNPPSISHSKPWKLEVDINYYGKKIEGKRPIGKQRT